MRPGHSRRQILFPFLTFAIADVLCVAIVLQIPSSRIGWSYTGFHGLYGEFMIGLDVVWFSMFLVATFAAFVLPARLAWRRVGSSLWWRIGMLAALRIVFAYTLWCNTFVVRPLIQRALPGAQRWPPWGPMDVAQVVVVEIGLLVLCTWGLAQRQRFA